MEKITAQSWLNSVLLKLNKLNIKILLNKHCDLIIILMIQSIITI